MNDRSSEQRPVESPLTPPTDTLKEQWIRENATEFQFNEDRLNGQPECLKTFVDQFLRRMEDTYYGNRLIWTLKKSFVRVGFLLHELPGAYQNYLFELLLRSDSHEHSLFIHSSTLYEAMSCLDLLVGLHDDHFEKMELFHGHEDEDD
jgi:hypothetical protein